ncbi:MAG: hypothetical protein KGN01_08100 [Patescibacteria group bacterium]|nr:hypothetical protein [Patescibacteria group bacterium]
MESQLQPPPAPQVFAKPQGQRLRWWAWSWIGKGLVAYALWYAFQQGTFGAAYFGFGPLYFVEQLFTGLTYLFVMLLIVGLVFKRAETLALLGRALHWLRERKITVA